MGGGFEVETSRGVFQCAALVIATGGLSIPKMGATPFGYEVARQFGLRIVECRPALVPFTFGGADRERFDGLAGVSAEVTAAVVRANGSAFREKLLFTHRGLSGPAILQASSYWRAGECVEIDLLPGVDFAAALAECRAAGARAEVRTVLARYLPKRLADRWCQVQGVSKTVVGAERSRDGGDRGGRCTHGVSSRPEPRGTRKPRSRAAAWTPASCRRRRWSAARCRVSTSSAKWWM